MTGQRAGCGGIGDTEAVAKRREAEGWQMEGQEAEGQKAEGLEAEEEKAEGWHARRRSRTKCRGV